MMDSEPIEQNVNKPTTFRSKYLSKNPMVPWKRLVDLNLDLMSKANKSSQNHHCASVYHFDNILDDCKLTSTADCSSCEREYTLTNNAGHSRYEPVSSHLKEVDGRTDEIKSSKFTEMRFTNVGLFGKARNVHELDECKEYVQGEITSSRKTLSRNHQDHKTVDQLNELRQKHGNITCLDASNQKNSMSVPQWSPPNPRDYPKRYESDDETSDLTKRTEVSSDHSFKKTMLRDDIHFVHLNDSEIDDSGFATRDVTMLSFRYSGGAETNTDYESDWDENEVTLTTDSKELPKNSTVHYSDQNVVTDFDSHTTIEQEAAENFQEIPKMNDLPEDILEESTNVSNHIVSSPPTGLPDTEVIIPFSDNKHIFKSNGFENENPLTVKAVCIEKIDDLSDTKATKFIYTKMFSPNSFSRCQSFLDASCEEHSTYSDDVDSKVSDCLSPLVQFHNLEFQRDKGIATVTIVSERKVIESVSNDSQQRLKCERLLDDNGIADFKDETFLSKTFTNDVCHLVQRESENFKYINTHKSEDIMSNKSTNLDISEVRNAANIESSRRLKFLTRNPLTSWKRFVDVNIESLNFKKSKSISSNGADKVGHSIAKCQSNTETDRAIECIDSHRQKCTFTNFDLSGLQDDDFSGIFNKCKTSEEPGEENKEMPSVRVVIDDLQFDETSSSNVFKDDRIEKVFSLSNEGIIKNNDRFAVSLDCEKHSQQNEDIDNYLTHDNIHSQQTETTQNIEYAETVPLDFPLQNCIDYPKETVENGSLNLTVTLHNTLLPDTTLSVQPEHEEANSALDKMAKVTENYPSNILLEATLENQSIQVLLLPEMLFNNDDYSNGCMPTSLLSESQGHCGSQLKNERYVRFKSKPVPLKSNDRQSMKIKSRLKQQKYDKNEINKKTLHELEVVDVSRTSRPIDVEPKKSYDILGTVWSKLSKYIYGLVNVFNSSIHEDDDNLQRFNSASPKENINITTYERSEHFIKGDCVSKSMPDSKDRFISESDLRITNQVQIKKHSKRRKIDSNVETPRTDTNAQTDENSFSTESQLPFQTGETPNCTLEFHNKINADYFIIKGSQSADESIKYYNASPNNRVRLDKYVRQGQGQSEVIIDTKSAPNENELSAFFDSTSHPKSSQTSFTTAEKGLNCQKGTSTITMTQVLPENEASTNFPEESFRKLNLLTQTLPTILRCNPSLTIVREREELCSNQMHQDAGDDDVMTDDMLKSSLECLLEMLLQRGKVSQAFVATVQGEILAKTSGLPVKEQDVITIVCCLTSSYQGVTRITLFTIAYLCFKLVQSSTLVGRADNSIFVALQGKQTIIVGFAHPSSPGSCIREIQELSQALSQRGL
ncbi:fibroblast growth factor receptor 2 [Biomphalaria pfeifferi]|uniref:Fibroblast growth factor receptor 2 n=1 Tax=Biomphalaria pfeifferi TaxID=112525 RepID=A0AAD8F8S0_BIOPF|nr:fibroblast growth factor receptor 2 [Biomphalaria pfeifferi]